jgi:uncharacterized OB-fold protein
VETAFSQGDRSGGLVNAEPFRMQNETYPQWSGSMSDSGNYRSQLPIKNGLFTEPLTPLEDVRLAGSKCNDCGEVALGTVTSCPNCAGTSMKPVTLASEGKLWTYTVIRNRPPGDYKGPSPFEPFGEGLVELPDGIRVLSPLAGNVDSFSIGMKMKFEACKLYENADGVDVIAFRFAAVEEA